jgi:hypothetical protein
MLTTHISWTRWEGFLWEALFWRNAVFKSPNYHLLTPDSTLWTGWPDWANFSPLGHCLLSALFLKITEVAHIFGHLYSTVNIMQWFRPKNALGWILGDFVTHIWSPWLWIRKKTTFALKGFPFREMLLECIWLERFVFEKLKNTFPVFLQSNST